MLIVIVGAGVYGLTAALALRARGHQVHVLDPGPIPHPLAASTDVSKVVRMEYGADPRYAEMADRAIDGFLAWNHRWGEALYHNTGVLMLARHQPQPGDYVYDSAQVLAAQGHSVEWLDEPSLRRRFPAWRAEHYGHGFFNPRGGYAESGRIVAALAAEAQACGVTLHTGQMAETLVDHAGSIIGVRTRSGGFFPADTVLVAAGAWTHALLPELAPVLKATGHPVFHLRPANPALFTPPHFVTFTADVANTGWYGFPLLREGVVKLANHGVGEVLHAEQDERVVRDADVATLRHMLADTFPALQDAEIVYTRRCLYSDTPDGHFWIDHHPDRPGVVVAAGDSGHGFKFAPVLGDLIADIVERNPNPWAARFAWRTLAADTVSAEAARRRAAGA